MGSQALMVYNYFCGLSGFLEFAFGSLAVYGRMANREGPQRGNMGELFWCGWELSLHKSDCMQCFFMQRMLFLLFVMCFFVRARASDAEFCQHVAERRHMDPKRAHQSENQNTKSDPPKWKQIRKVKFLLKAGQKHCSVSIFLPMYQLDNAKVL